MARVRVVEIENFRSIRKLKWQPSAGVNCLIGPGDSGKSTILDAVDLCLGARRAFQFTDADFNNLNVEAPININVTIGDLGEELKNLESYGMYLRGFDSETGEIEDEPEKEAETVLTVNLRVESDLEPQWSLISTRAQAQQQSRNLAWADRTRIAPTRIGTLADYHLSWRRGSVLNRISEERPDASAALAKAGREARAAFGKEAEQQLSGALDIVWDTAEELGVHVSDRLAAMLDAHSISFSGGTISVHDDRGIPLRSLGTGSVRLLTAGLQRKASETATVVIIDEVEYGLEPHRIIRLLGSLGAKIDPPPLQVFMTTHSPVALRELSGAQLFVVRAGENQHECHQVGTRDDVQAVVRIHPEAFLGTAAVACEGASEVGLVRGLDQYRTQNGEVSINAAGIVLVDCGGGEPDRPFKRASAFLSLGYRALVIRDSDIALPHGVEEALMRCGGLVATWRNGRALEDELFMSLSDAAVTALLDRAIELHGEELVDNHIRSKSNNVIDLAQIRVEGLIDGFSDGMRAILGQAAQVRKAGWFKSVTWMENVAREIVGPDLQNADEEFVSVITTIFEWAKNNGA